MKLKEIVEKHKIEKSDFKIWLYNSLPKNYSASISYGAFGAVTIDDDSVSKIVAAYQEEKHRQCEVEIQKADEEFQRKTAFEEKRNKVRSIVVTTGDLKRKYEVIAPVYFQISNKGVFSSSLSDLKKE